MMSRLPNLSSLVRIWVLLALIVPSTLSRPRLAMDSRRGTTALSK